MNVGKQVPEFEYSSWMFTRPIRRGICALLRDNPDIEVTCDADDGIQASE